VSIDAPADRHYAAWLGGSIISSMSVFNQMLVKKAEWDEYGAESAVKRKGPTVSLARAMVLMTLSFRIHVEIRKPRYV